MPETNSLSVALHGNGNQRYQVAGVFLVSPGGGERPGESYDHAAHARGAGQNPSRPWWYRGRPMPETNSLSVALHGDGTER